MTAPASAGGAGRSGPIRVLTFTSLFPSDARPRHGIFVETRLRHLIDDCGVDARVVAPVPWFPFRHPAFGRFADLAGTPRRAVRGSGLEVSYPRYPMLPKLGVNFQAASMARWSAADIDALGAAGWRPEVIDAHYLYPDGVAAARIAERLGVPLLLTARGTDVNVLARMPGPAREIRWAAGRAAGVVAVSEPLRQGLIELGVEPSKVVVLRNGVDLEIFRPEEQSAARRRLGWDAGPMALCVGNLVPEKGFALAVGSLVQVPALRLVIVGAGPERPGLEALARRLGVFERVRFQGNMPQAELRHAYAGVDVLLLTSTREGWPNVVLEALACGTPVVAVDVGAVRSMLDDRRVGRIVLGRDPATLAAEVADLLASMPSREDARRHAAKFDWHSISAGQYELMARAVSRTAP